MRLLLAVLLASSMWAQTTLNSTVTDSRPLVQKFFGTTAPGTVPGNTPGDLYFDRTGHKVYYCDGLFACTTVAVGNWTVLTTGTPTPPVTAQWSMGFWTAWGPDPNARLISAIDWGAMTHIIQVGVEPQSNGSLKFSDTGFAANATAIVATAHANNVKAVLNVWSGQGSDINGAVTNNLNTLLTNIMGVVNQYGYDGVDVDWESGLNFNSMTILLSNLRTRLGPTKSLTADVSSNDSAYWGTAHQYLDRVNVMTYDMGGTWNPYSWVNSALFGDPCDCVWSIEYTKRKMTTAGVPLAKLSVGLPFYGYVSSGGGITGPRQPWGATLPSLSQTIYTSLVAQFNVPTALWDAGTHTPYIKTATGWVTFDNAQSLTEKISYVKTNNMGGWIIWAIDQDYISGATVKHPLMAAVRLAR